jgi:hypothetical protein
MELADAFLVKKRVIYCQQPFFIVRSPSAHMQSEPDKAANANNRNPAGSNVSLNASD